MNGEPPDRDVRPKAGTRRAGGASPAGLPPAFPAARRIRRFAGPWRLVGARLTRDRAGLAAGALLAGYLAVALGVWLGAWGQDWSATAGPMWAPPSAEYWFGTNVIGQDIFQRAIQSTATAFEIGFAVALLATALGAVLGGAAGAAGSWADESLLWAAGVIDSIPFFLFVAALSFALEGWPWAVHAAMIAAFWTTTARLVRAEVRRLRTLPFVEAARAAGLSWPRILFRHLLPNTTHIMLVQATLAFVAAIKAEVILSFLGLGNADVSWGQMIAESTQEILAGQFANFASASLMLMGLVLAFNLFADSLQDAMDPRSGVEP